MSDQVASFSEDQSLWDRLDVLARVHPKNCALIQPEHFSFSYLELWRMLGALETVLREAGIASTDCVAVILPDGVAGVITVLGAAYVCACSPMNPALTASEIAADLTDVNAVAVITSAELDIPRSEAQRMGLLLIEASITAEGCKWEVHPPSLQVIASPTESRLTEDVRILLHTSATTGKRKLVPLSASNLRAMIGNTAKALELQRHDRLLMMARLFHIQGILSPFSQLFAGGSVVVTPGFKPGAFLEWINTFQPTWYTGGPTLHRAILSELDQDWRNRTTSLRFVRSGGAPLPSDLRIKMENTLGIPVLDVYGLTETGAVACTTLKFCDDDQIALKRGAVGRSMGPEISILDPEGVSLPAGSEGEVAVKGPTVMSGYLNDPASNQDVFLGPWFRTGDLGWIDGDGCLYITGRLKEIINRGGQKIVPNEIDSVLLAHRGVQEVATFGIFHPTLGEDVACVVVLKANVEVSENELRQVAARSLAAFKVPQKILRVRNIPYGATGKPQRLLLGQQFAKGGIESLRFPPIAVSTARQLSLAERSGPIAPSIQLTPKDLTQTLNDVWLRHLEGETVEQSEHFFFSGGDSLTAISLLAEINTLFALKTNLDQAEFFDNPTFTTLTHMVANALAGRAISPLSSQIQIIDVSRGLGKAPLFMVPADGEEGACFRRLSRRLGAEWPLALVRPKSTWHERSLDCLETGAERTIAAIRAAAPKGPYIIGGYCYGGVVAFNVACRLELLEEAVLLILFDVPTPGYPHLLKQWRSYFKFVGNAAAVSTRVQRVRPFLGAVRRVIRRTAWFAIRVSAPQPNRFWNTSPIQWICRQAQKGYFSFYRPRSCQMPVLHFMARNEEDALLAEARHGWARLGLIQDLTTEWIPGGHEAVLEEANLGVVVSKINAWVEAHL